MRNLDLFNSDKTFTWSIFLTRHYKDGESCHKASLSFPLPIEWE